MIITTCLERKVYWTFQVHICMWGDVWTRWSSPLLICCVPSRSGCWSPSSGFPFDTARCRSPLRTERQLRCSHRPSGSWVLAQWHQEHEYQKNSGVYLNFSSGEKLSLDLEISSLPSHKMMKGQYSGLGSLVWSWTQVSLCVEVYMFSQCPCGLALHSLVSSHFPKTWLEVNRRQL